MSAPHALPGTVKDQVIAGFTQAASGYDEGGRCAIGPGPKEEQDR